MLLQHCQWVNLLFVWIIVALRYCNEFLSHLKLKLYSRAVENGTNSTCFSMWFTDEFFRNHGSRWGLICYFCIQISIRFTAKLWILVNSHEPSRCSRHFLLKSQTKMFHKSINKINVSYLYWNPSQHGHFSLQEDFLPRVFNKLMGSAFSRQQVP